MREPDADSGLFQVLVNSSQEHYAPWEKQFKEYVQKLYGVESSEEEEDTTMTAPSPKKASKGMSGMAILFFLSIVAVAMAVMYQFSAITDQYSAFVNNK